MRHRTLKSQVTKQTQQPPSDKSSKPVHLKPLSSESQSNEIEENDLFSGFSKLKTTRGSPMIKMGGYEYIRDYEVNEKVYWKCRLKCEGRAISIGYDQRPFYIKEHDCSCLRKCEQEECSDYFEREVEDDLNTERENSKRLFVFPDKTAILSIFFFIFMYFYDNFCYESEKE
jgi:hypothetical protein